MRSLAEIKAVASILEIHATNAFKARSDVSSKRLPVIDPRDWQDKPIPKRKWFVEGLIPSRVVTIFSGDGGTGKTQLINQLIASSVLGIPWLGKAIAPGPCLFYGAEDEEDELHRRFATIVDHAGHQLSDLFDISLIPMAGLDAVLAEPNKAGQIVETELFSKLKAEVAALKPKLVIVDPSADVFGGDEINRAQVRQFVTKLMSLALDYDCAVILLSHPSLAGLNSGTGTSGSTAWNNSVRSRLYLQAVKDEPDRRILTVVKANHGRVGEEIPIRWEEGVFVLDTGTDPVVESLLNRKVEEVFMSLLRTHTASGQTVSPKHSNAYAPTVLAEKPAAKGYDKKKLEAAMQRLLDKDEIHIVTKGPPSRERTTLELGPAPTNGPTNGLPTGTNGM
jgi:RecA-family ATPase